VLDPGGIVVATAASFQRSPSVAYAGGNFVVVWLDQRVEIAGDLYGARVSPAGTVLDPSGVPLVIGAEAVAAPTVVGGGAEVLVTWRAGGSTAGVVGRRFTPALAPVDLASVSLTPATAVAFS